MLGFLVFRDWSASSYQLQLKATRVSAVGAQAAVVLIFLFATGASFGVEAAAKSMQDFDGDGEVDEVSIWPGAKEKDPFTLSVMLRKNGKNVGFVDMRFQLSQSVDEPKPRIWLFGDVDGDKKVDVVLVNIKKDKESIVRVYRNTGLRAGTVLDPQRFEGKWPSDGWSLEDFDKKARLDLVNRYTVTIDRKKVQRTWVFSGSGDGTFEKPVGR